jgi:hypothetical protein
VGRHFEELSGTGQLAALLLKFSAQIGDESQEAVRVVSEWPGVAGPVQLVSQQSLGLVAFGPGPLGHLLGGQGSLPCPFQPLLGDGGTLSPVLGFSPGRLGNFAVSGRLRSDRLDFVTYGFGPGQLCCPAEAVSTLALCIARPFPRSPSGRRVIWHGRPEYPDATKDRRPTRGSSATCKSV